MTDCFLSVIRLTEMRDGRVADAEWMLFKEAVTASVQNEARSMWTIFTNCNHIVFNHKSINTFLISA